MLSLALDKSSGGGMGIGIVMGCLSFHPAPTVEPDGSNCTVYATATLALRMLPWRTIS